MNYKPKVRRLYFKINFFHDSEIRDVITIKTFPSYQSQFRNRPEALN